MILPDRQIRQWAAGGNVSPYNPEMINPASLDLRLGNMIREPNPIWYELTTCKMRDLIISGAIEKIPLWGDEIEFTEYWLMPQGHGASFVLCHSLEFVNIPDDVCALLFSKSSTGRRGLEHLHAGYGDCGWHGSQWTWELHNVAPWPIKLVRGQPLMQQVMIRMTDRPLRTYAETGRYNGQIGPTPERVKHEAIS